MQKNDFLRITFKAKLKETDQLFDNSEDIPIVVGAGYTIPGVDEALLNINLGEKKSFEITPDKAFGDRNLGLIKLVTLSEFRRHGTNPVPGMMVEADNMRGRVLSVSGGRVRIDFNHPLAGKTLVYDIEVKQKIESPEEKIKALIEIYTRIKDKINANITEKTVEIEVPPMINSLIKKKVADDIMLFLGLEKVKFVEIFEKPKEQEQKENKV